MNLDSLFEEFNSKKVLILGDAMIDAYMWGDINRISPEAPIPIVEINKHENRLGGAANVALNIKSLGAEPILCSVIGDDNQGVVFQKLMKKAELSTEGILIEKRKTTIKTRVIAEGTHQIRIDEEDTFDIVSERSLSKLINSLISTIDVVILQDYNKGVLTPHLITSTIKLANTHNIPTIIDPKIKNFKCYKNCTIFKPNIYEINKGMNTKINVKNIKELKCISEELRILLNVTGVLLTLSEEGICIKTKESFFHHHAFKRKIIDISGAGDTVLSVAALCLASKTTLQLLSKLSNLAGGIVCENVGVVAINKKKLLTEASLKEINNG